MGAGATAIAPALATAGIGTGIAIGVGAGGAVPAAGAPPSLVLEHPSARAINNAGIFLMMRQWAWPPRAVSRCGHGSPLPPEAELSAPTRKIQGNLGQYLFHEAVDVGRVREAAQGVTWPRKSMN